MLFVNDIHVSLLVCCQRIGISDLRLGHALAVDHARTMMVVAAPHQGLLAWLCVAPQGEQGFNWPVLYAFEEIKGPGLFLNMSFVGKASATCLHAVQ